MRTLAQAYAALPAALFVGIVESPPSILLAVAADTGMDAGKALKAALESHGGRGGGNPRSAQGTVKDLAMLESVATSIVRS
jgi:alanyl-tRNA synthetase